MKTILLLLLAVIWIAGLGILVVALTDLYPGNPFKEHAFVIGIGFISVTGLIRQAYIALTKPKNRLG